jgi:hypothetical protein
MRKAHPNARFWLHQSKLIEGVDDPNFVAMALYDLMGNARQVIQQIGRMIRWKQRADKAQQSGFVLANEPNISRAKTIWAILEDVIAAIIKDGEKKARDAETEARRHELAVRREQERKQREQKREQEATDKRAERSVGNADSLTANVFSAANVTGSSCRVILLTIHRAGRPLAKDWAFE